MLESMSKRVNRGLTEEEMHHYRKPYPDVESRRPILAFVRSIPVAGEPAEVVRVMDEGRKWIMEASVPKLFVGDLYRSKVIGHLLGIFENSACYRYASIPCMIFLRHDIAR